MPVNGWFPKVNSNGDVASGQGEIYVNGVLIDTGLQPHWIDVQTIVYMRVDDTIRIRNLATSAVTDIAFTANKLAADGGKWMALQQSGGITLRLYSGSSVVQEWSGRGGPELAPNGSWCNYDNFQGDSHTVYRDGTPVFTGILTQATVTSTDTCVCEATSAYGRKVLLLPNTDCSVRDWEDPRVIAGPDGDPWILSVTQNGMIFRPAGSVVGYEWLGENQYLNPHARYVVDHFVIVANTQSGVLITLEVNPTEQRYNLLTGQPSAPESGVGAGGGGVGGGATGGIAKTLISTGTFEIVPDSEEVVELPLEIFPTWPTGQGHGRIIHPTLGAFDYEVKPDEWVNIDAEAIIAPVWASSRTLTGAANVLWNGDIRDVVVEERWKALGGLAMPITQLRMLMAIWTTPIDPDVGYVLWYPSYITVAGFRVLPVNLSAGGGQGIAFDDVVNYKDEFGDPIGWITAPVTFQLRIVERLT